MPRLHHNRLAAAARAYTAAAWLQQLGDQHLQDFDSKNSFGRHEVGLASSSAAWCILVFKVAHAQHVAHVYLIMSMVMFANALRCVLFSPASTQQLCCAKAWYCVLL